MEKTSQPDKDGPDIEELKGLAEGYLTRTFSRHLSSDDFRISELSPVPDWNISNEEFGHYNIQGKFKNFAINDRILSGRLETKIKVRKQTGQSRSPSIEEKDNKEIIVTLLVDDHLSDELRDALVKDYIYKNYDNPLGIDIKKERLEVYPDKIYSYATAVVNNASIVYLKAVFEKPQVKEEKVNIFFIKETPWQLNRAEVESSAKIPDFSRIRKDIKDRLFEMVRTQHFDFCGKVRVGNPNPNLSKIESISKMDPVEANLDSVRIEIDLEYLVKWWGLPGSYRRYNVLAYVHYKYIQTEEKWEYESIESLVKDNIKMR
ncbi:MAG: hypothetical protein LBI14_02630 [Treponema sp.]|jgi:hypothetical protein|nr:hypothetical protein [Treponema sp.]